MHSPKQKNPYAGSQMTDTHRLDPVPRSSQRRNLRTKSLHVHWNTWSKNGEHCSLKPDIQQDNTGLQLQASSIHILCPYILSGRPEPSGENRKPILRKYCVRRYTIFLTMKPLLMYIFLHFPIPQRARHQDMRKGLSGHCPKDMCNQQKASGECHSEIQ